MSKIVVIGHKNPDTDSVISAIVLSKVLGNKEDFFYPAVAGKLNSETEFILSHFNENAPVIMEKLTESNVFLVDHNELSQSIEGVDWSNITGVLDHHRLSGVNTEKPLFFRTEPLGSTCTLVYKLIKETGKKVEKKEAGLLLCGVISDTLYLKSGTTTEEDEAAVRELSNISEVDPDEISEKMFEAKSDFSKKSLKEIVIGDMKEFDFSGKKIAIGVCETTSTSYFKDKEEDVLKIIKETTKEGGYDAFFFGVVDILNKNTTLYLGGEEEVCAAKEAFSLSEKESIVNLPGITSRKSELVPPLSKYYKEN